MPLGSQMRPDHLWRITDVCVFEGWIVTVDAVCHVDELPPAVRRWTEGGSFPNISETEQELTASCLPQIQQTSRQESKFHLPRGTGAPMPPTCDSKTGAVLGCVLRHPYVGPTLQQKCLEPGKKAHTAAQDGTVNSAKRSGMQIPISCMPCWTCHF